jgi:hypothetical protein
MEVQSHHNVSNANSIEQLYTVGGRADYQSKKEYLIKQRASKRYHSLLKDAKKHNLTLSQFATKNYDCTVDEYCGSEYIQSKVFNGFSPSLSDDQLKSVKKITAKYKKSLPFFMPIKQFNVLVQAALYNLSRSETHLEIKSYKQCDSIEDTLHYTNEHSLQSSKNRIDIRNKIGIENIVNNIYVKLEDENYNKIHAHAVDYFFQYILSVETNINKIIEDQGEVDYNELTFKELTSQHRSWKDMMRKTFVVDQSSSLTSILLDTSSKDTNIFFDKATTNQSPKVYNSIFY